MRDSAQQVHKIQSRNLNLESGKTCGKCLRVRHVNGMYHLDGVTFVTRRVYHSRLSNPSDVSVTQANYNSAYSTEESIIHS